MSGKDPLVKDLIMPQPAPTEKNAPAQYVRLKSGAVVPSTHPDADTAVPATEHDLAVAGIEPGRDTIAPTRAAPAKPAAKAEARAGAKSGKAAR